MAHDYQPDRDMADKAHLAAGNILKALHYWLGDDFANDMRAISDFLREEGFSSFAGRIQVHKGSTDIELSTMEESIRLVEAMTYAQR